MWYTFKSSLSKERGLMTKDGKGLGNGIVDKVPVKVQENEKPVLIGISGGRQIFRVNGKIVVQ